MFDFKDKVLLVTGAASGIGAATARYFAGCGANVMLGDINESAIRQLADEIDPSGRRIGFMKYDASNARSASDLLTQCIGKFRGIDFLVPSAAIYEDHVIDGMTDEQWLRTISVNLNGVFYLIRSAIPLISEGGAIVNLASQAAHSGGSYAHGHYGATKGAVLAFTRTLAKELAPRIRANAVSPGTIETPMLTHILAENGAATAERTPMKRLGKPIEVASVIAFLCSEAASFVTGETILVTGGSYMGG